MGSGPLSTSSRIASNLSALCFNSSATSPRCTRVRPSSIGRPAHRPRRPRFHSTTAGTSSATITSADTRTVLSTAAKVKPIPRPPTSIRAFSIPLRRVQANSANASSEWCLRLFIRSPGRPETRMANSSLHCDRVSSVSLPGTVVLAIVIQRSMGLVKVARFSRGARYHESAQTGVGPTFLDY